MFLLHQKIVELQNVYQLEVSVQDKACFPDDNSNSNNPYKTFLKKNSNERLKNTYKVKIQKSAKKLIDWMDEHYPSWNAQCPFHKMSRQFKRLTSSNSKAEESPLNFSKLKSDAILLAKLLEKEDPDSNSLSIDLQDLIKHFLRSINTINEKET